MSFKPPSLRRIKRKLRKWSKNPRAILLALLLTGATATVVSVWNRSTDLPLRRARLALDHGEPTLAKRIVQGILSSNPQNMGALCVRAKAQLALSELHEARQALDKVMAREPDRREARDLLVQWSFRTIRASLRSPDFASNDRTQASVISALSVGNAQCDWLARRSTLEQQVQGRFLRACLLEADIRRARALRGSPTVDALRQVSVNSKLEERLDAVQEHLEYVTATDPTHIQAWKMLISLLTDRRDAGALWQAAERLSQQKEIPPALAARLVDALLSTVGSSLPPARLTEQAWAVLAAVGPDGHRSMDFAMSASRLHLYANEPVEAEQLVVEALSYQPTNPDAAYLLARSLLDQTRFVEAIAALDDLAVSSPRSAALHALRGQALLAIDDTVGAIDALSLSLQLDPEQPSIRAVYFNAMSMAGRLSEIETEVRERFAAAPSDAQAIRLLLHLEQSLGDRGAVERSVDDVTSLPLLSDNHRLVLIEAHLYLGHLGTAKRLGQNFAKRRPEIPEGYLAVGNALLAQGRAAEAIKTLQAMPTRSLGSRRVVRLLARCYLQNGRFERAARVLAPAANAHTGDPGVGLPYAEALLGMGLTGDAIPRLQYLLRRNPENAAIRTLLARADALSGSPDLADDVFAEADADRIDASRNPTLAARIRLLAGDHTGAISICEQSVVSGNDDPTLRILLAQIHSADGNLDEAAFHLRRLVEISPGSATHYALISRLYYDMDQADAGLVAFSGMANASRAMSLYGRGVLLSMAERYEEAERVLASSLDLLIKSLDERSIIVADAIARIHVGLNNWSAAIRVYEKLTDVDLIPLDAALRQVDLAARLGQAGDSQEKLDEYASLIGDNRPDIRYAFMQRFAALGRHDQALDVLSDWSRATATTAPLSRARAELLADAGRLDEAVEAYEEVVRGEGSSAAVHLRLFQLHMARYDFPEAEQQLEAMSQVDDEAKTRALVELGLLYVALDLPAQVSGVCDRLGGLRLPRDPGVLMKLSNLWRHADREEAAHRALNRIPRESPPYPAAQLSLARDELRLGLRDDAADRLESLLNSPTTAEQTARLILSSSDRLSRSDSLFELADRTISSANSGRGGPPWFEIMPRALRIQWLNTKCVLASQDHDWPELADRLATLANLIPEQRGVAMARAVVLMKLGRSDGAASIVQSYPKMADGPEGAMLRLALGRHSEHAETAVSLAAGSTSDASRTALDEVRSYVLAGDDAEGARAAARRMILLRTSASSLSQGAASLDAVFGADLLEDVDRREGNGFATLYQQRMAQAILAWEAGLSELCSAICSDALASDPTSVLAAALSVEALRSRGSDMKAPRAPTQGVPNSRTAAYVTAHALMAAADTRAAVDALRSLIERTPGHLPNMHLLSRALVRDGQIEEAIAMLERIAGSETESAKAAETDNAAAFGPGSWSIVAANDLAYVLAIHRPDRMDEAFAIADRAMKIAPKYPALRDTLGWIEHLRGNDEAAIHHLSRAIAAGNPSRDVHLHLGAVYRALGHDRWAQFHFERASNGVTADRTRAATARRHG